MFPKKNGPWQPHRKINMRHHTVLGTFRIHPENPHIQLRARLCTLVIVHRVWALRVVMSCVCICVSPSLCLSICVCVSPCKDTSIIQYIYIYIYLFNHLYTYTYVPVFFYACIKNECLYDYVYVSMFQQSNSESLWRSFVCREVMSALSYFSIKDDCAMT